MEAFSLLKYWRSNGGVGGGGGGFGTNVSATGDGNVSGNVITNVRTSTTTTIVTAVRNQMSETDNEEEEEEEEEESDDGPFFDLEFSLPEGDDEHAKNERNDVLCGEEEDENDDSDGSDSEGEEEDERELKFTLSSGSSGDSTTEDPNVSLSPSDDLFFKGRLVPVEQTTEANSKPPQFRVSLMKSATKFRVMMLKFKKSKSDSNAHTDTAEGTESVPSNSKDEQTEKAEQEEKTSQANEKSLMVKVNVEEVPILSLFTRDNSSKAPPKKQQNVDESVSSDEKKFSKEAMQRYLKKVKPLYVRVSKRYGEKLKFSGQLSLAGAIKANLAPPPSPSEQKPAPGAKPKSEKESSHEVAEPPLLSSTAKGLKQGNLPAGLRVVCKHLGKSRSASAAVAAAPPGTTSSKRRDDSLLQQQDGIQSAILHCKRSFKASRELDSSILSRSTSESSCYGNNLSSSSSAKNTVEMKKSL